MSLSQNEDEYAFDEDDLLEEIASHIPHEFFNSKGNGNNTRTLNTIALLDYTIHVKEARQGTPSLSQFSAGRQRRKAIQALKQVVPEKFFVEVGADAGEHSVDSEMQRELVLLAAQAYMSELMSPEARPGLEGSGTPEAQRVPDLDYSVHDLHKIKAAPSINTPIDRLVLNAREAQTFACKQGEQVQQLSKDKAGLEQIIMEHRRELARQRQDVENAGILRSMMTAAVGREAVENALRLVREGASVEDVTAEVLKRAIHPSLEGQHVTSTCLQD